MSQWNTLNNGVTDTSNNAVELQIEKLLQEYQNTLKLHQKGQIQLAKQKYEELISQELVKNEQKPTESSPNNKIATPVKDSPLSTLRFLVYKNYASILKDEFMTDQSNVDVAKQALKNYLQAVKIDPTEHSLWHHVGCLSYILKKLRFARLAFETGFYISDDDRKLKFALIDPNHALQIVQNGKYTPMQWKCLEGLCQVLFDIGDYCLCLFYINIVLSRQPTWEKGQQIKNQIQSSYTIDDTANINFSMNEPQIDPILITLERCDWLTLAEALFKEYKCFNSNNDNMSKKKIKEYESEDDFIMDTIFLSKTIRITVKEEKEKKEEETDSSLIPHKQTTLQESIIIPSSTIAIDTNNSEISTVNNDISVSPTPMDITMTEENISSLKRKRENDGEVASSENDNEKNNSGNEEEDEAEEKRLSLRASKRQRDKIANEEISRLKMLEEEKEFVDKVQAFYNKFEGVQDFKRKKSWYESMDEPLDLFWEWFDSKISELDSNYSWDIGNDISIELGKCNGDNNLVLFIPSQSSMETVTENFGNTEVSLNSFIDNLNENNSGIIDSLCKMILTLIRGDMRLLECNENIPIININFLELITDIITDLQSNFTESILSSKDTSQYDCIFILLRISEYFIDRLIRSTMSSIEETGLHPSNNSNRKKVSTSLAKQSKLQVIKNLIEYSSFWIGLVEQSILSSSILSSLNNASNYISLDRGVVTQEYISTEDYEVQLRFYSLKAKLAQCRNNVEEAYAWYSECKSVLKQINLKSSQDIRFNLRSQENIEKKLSLLEVGKLFMTAKQKIASKNYTGAIEDLERLVKPKLFNFGKAADSNEIIQMTFMLATAYMKDNKYLDAWNCYLYLFCSFMKQLTVYGHLQMQSESRFNKNDDIEYFNILQNINIVVDNLVSLITKENREEWFPNEVNQIHPDFVPLVNNFTTPDIPPHRPSKVTKSNIFNDIIVKSWVLQSYLIQHMFRKNSCSVANDTMILWAELLQELHDELGEREVCGVAKNIFLHHLLETFIKIDNKIFRREIYQCYHCLYDVHLAAESDMIEEHHCIHTKLDQKAAELLFTLVADTAVDKLRGGILLKNDLKDAVDTVSDLFENLPTSHPYIRNNQKIIENYLFSQLTIYPSLDSILRAAIIPTIDIDSKKTNTSSVLYKIFWIRGKTLRLQIKNRAKLNNEKNMIDLEDAVEEFMSHIILSPDDADGWCELGACYQLLADEELNWSASNIKEHKDVISEYQRKAFHAYIRGLYLRKLSSTKTHESEIFANFGSLLYSIVSLPMNMDAFLTQTAQYALASDGKLFEVQRRAPSQKYVYRLAIIMYNQALKYQSVDRIDWKYYYMLGKCFAKIERPPKEVLDWYLQAICRVKAKNRKSDCPLEPFYLFYSSLLKYLYKNELNVEIAEELLAKEKILNTKKQEDNSNQDVTNIENSTNITEKEINSMNNQILIDLSQDTMHLSSDIANIYNSIHQRLIDIRAADSKGVHHRVTYRLAWMYHYVYRNTEKAKTELLKLFTLKPTIKNHITIWKPGFELPGKHYEYVNKYTLFLIELAKQSKDTQTLKQLYRKLRRSQALLIDDRQVFRLAYTSYLQVIKDRLMEYYDAGSIMTTIKNSHLSKEEFETICSTFVKSVLGEKPVTDKELYDILQDLSELRRLTQGFITANDTDHDGLNDTIQICFAAFVFEDKINFEKLQDQSATVNSFPSNEVNESENQNFAEGKLLDVLLAQAKILMQSIITSSR
ncbi:uncharacterized protein BX663DRAFT_483630 [Cokeromyces recurvatus]|uniref:uncharacterized protein n=1 Tax=Cokeromyces recurvatus TaxID=90255 RepID=UPI002220E2A8|nr:uncharacterized protein BX663DRAFT_483630 [Cokeromyces recurvatus]KAI7905962.1 hypothetical protein BX663DRAFT_483630 [Cokeromyces recurvatus]